MRVPATIFREYDIRGHAGDQLDAVFAEALGRAFSTHLRQDVHRPRVVIGGDNRESSRELTDGLAAGLAGGGAEVIRLGTVPTPVLYFADHEFEADGSIQVTGSHNPPEYNGFKMVRRGQAVFGSEVQDLRSIIEREDFFSGPGSIRHEEILDRYVEAVAERAGVEGSPSMVLDCGNGTGSVIAVRALEAAGVEVDPLYCESDGSFPNHHPDPTVDEYMADLEERVSSTGAPLGVGLDGDADRIGAVTDEGELVRGDHLLLLFALDVLEEHPDAPVIFDVKCSQAVPELIEEAGGRPIMWRTGHSLIKQKMRREGSPISGEMSGHIFFADNWFGFDDAIYAAARLAGIVADAGRPLSELLEQIPRYPSTPELRLDCPEDRKFRVVEQTVEHYRKSHEVVDIDGARIQFDGGWALVRASNTQPVVVVRFEASDRERLQRIRDEVAEYLAGHGVEVPPLSEP